MGFCCIFNNALLWTAIGSVATGVMAIATFITIRQNRKQSRELFRQNFENTVVFLIKEFKDARTRIKYNGDIHGYDALLQGWEHFRMQTTVENYNSISTINKPPRFRSSEELSSKEFVLINYFLVVDNNLCDLNGYYESLVCILDFIDNSDYNTVSKKKYIGWVENNLSELELKLLFYICAFDEQKKELRLFVEKWGLLHNLAKAKLINLTHATWLSSDAFESK